MLHGLAACNRTALALLWLSVCADPVLADQSVTYDSRRIASMEVGIFCRGEVGATPSAGSGTIKGTVERLDANPPLVKKTRSVPAIDQITFGVEAREAVENGVVTITVTHPPLGAGRVTTEHWETQMDPARTTVHSYYLGLSDGNPVGRWTIVGSVGSRTLFQAEFDVVPRKGAKDPCRNRATS
jgi:hypothetical protein